MELKNSMTLKETLNKTDRFALNNGIQLTEVGEGYARAEMTVEERHLNGGNVCQGGALFTLADLTFAAAANSHGRLCLGINNQIHYVKSALLGDHLVAECREMSSRKIHLLEARVTNQNGDLIALMTGECFMKDVIFEFDGLM